MPFFSSISTTSPASFIKNLHRKGNHRLATRQCERKMKNWRIAQCNDRLQPSKELKTLIIARIEFKYALKTGSRERSCIVPDQLHDGRVLNADVYFEFQQKGTSVNTTVSQSRRRILRQKNCDREVSLLGTAREAAFLEAPNFSYFGPTIRTNRVSHFAIFQNWEAFQIVKLSGRVRARFYAVPSESVS